MVFIETSIFTTQITRLMSDDDYAAFQSWLAAHPNAGQVIQGTGGLRKIRVPAKGKGKSGGARVIYYHFAVASQIALVFAYAKNVRTDLTPGQKKMLRAIIEKWR
jgi:hypothetical protein